MALTDFNIVVHPQSGTSGSAASNPTVAANRQAIVSSLQSYNDTIKDRYNQVQGKSASDLATMGITLVDGTYFKNGVAWLTANNIETIEGKKPATPPPVSNNPDSLASGLTDASMTTQPAPFFSKYGVWLIGGAIVLISGILLLIPKKKS